MGHHVLILLLTRVGVVSVVELLLLHLCVLHHGWRCSAQWVLVAWVVDLLLDNVLVEAVHTPILDVVFRCKEIHSLLL